MDQLVFLQDLAVVMTVSAAIMILCRRVKLPVVLGYIIAGAIIGPNTPPYAFVKDLHSIHILSELGVIFLLFSIGLEFSLSRLAKVGLVSFFAATFEIVLMMWIGFSLGQVFGWNYMDSLFLGAILAISSTTIIAKVLLEMKKIKEKFAQVILGILIIEDLLAIVIIALLSGIASTGSLEIKEIGFATIRVFSFVAAVLFFGFLLVPRLLKYLARIDSDEMTVITVLGLCFGVSLAAAKFGFSVALGAFLIGAVIAETKQVESILHKIASIRDMFTAIFFVSVGMLLSPQTVMEYWLPILILTLATIVGKVFSCSLAAFLTGYKPETALKVGLGLAQIGEFSFIIARLGEGTDVTSPFLYPIAVSVSGITTLTTPLLMRNAGPITQALSRAMPKPFATLLGLYTGWLEKIRTSRSQKQGGLFKSAQPYLVRLLLYSGGALGFFYGASHLQGRFEFLPANIFWIVLGGALLPWFLGIAFTVDKLFWNVFFVSRFEPKQGSGREAEVDQILHNALRFLMVLALGAVFLAVGSGFLPRLPLTVGVLGLIVLGGIILWGSARKVHERIEKVVLGVFDTEKPLEKEDAKAIQQELVKLIHEEYPWDVVTEDFLLPYRETAANQSIRDLRLRSETGATIVAIYRSDDTIPNPPPETKLQPGDVIMLMGDSEQVKTAIKFLNQKIKEAPAAVERKEGKPKTEAYHLPEGSEFEGKTLHDLKLRRKTGVTILGLQKGNVTINNPGPDSVLEQGDVLVMFGWPDQIKAALAYLAPKQETSEE